MKQIRAVAAISAITFIMAAPTFAEQRDTQGTGSQTTTEGVAAGQKTRTAVKDEHKALVARVEAALRADPAAREC